MQDKQYETIAIEALDKVTGGEGCGTVIINNNNGSGSANVGSDAVAHTPGTPRRIPNNDRWT